MNGVGAVKTSLEMSKGWIMGLIQDMQDEPLTAPTPKGGNHPLWVLGHLVYSEGMLVHCLVKGEANPYEQWKELFDTGSTPSSDAGKYPSMEELFSAFEKMRGETLAYVDTLTDDDLDKPSKAEGELAQLFGTIGQCLLAIGMHFTYHGGQVADARRAAGRAPLMG
jgi:uncharacterized damage-inducible protein DinB